MTWAMYFDWYLKSLIVSGVTMVAVAALGIIVVLMDKRR
jgi:hypothetical protein